MSRKRILSEELIEQLCAYVRAGNYNIIACRAMGVIERTFYNWLERGQRELNAREEDSQEPESLYIQLYQSLKKAEAEAEAAMVTVVREAGSVGKQWLAAATHLERRAPERWARRERRSIEITESRHIEVTHIETIKDYGHRWLESEKVELPGQETKELPPGEGKGATDA